MIACIIVCFEPGELKGLLEKQSMTFQDLANATNFSATVLEYFAGNGTEKGPSISTTDAEIIANALGTTLEELLTHKNPEKENPVPKSGC